MDDSSGYIAIKLPRGESRVEIRDIFAKLGNSQPIYDSERNQVRPEGSQIAEIFSKMNSNQALILLGSNGWTMQNELLAFVVFSVEGWKDLMNVALIYPKIVKIIPWSLIEPMIDKPKVSTDPSDRVITSMAVAKNILDLHRGFYRGGPAVFQMMLTEVIANDYKIHRGMLVAVFALFSKEEIDCLWEAVEAVREQRNQILSAREPQGQ